MSRSATSPAAARTPPGRIVLDLPPAVARQLRRLGADTLGGVSGAVADWLEALARRPAVTVRVCCQACSLTMTLEQPSLEALEAHLAEAPWRRWARGDGTTICNRCMKERLG